MLHISSVMIYSIAELSVGALEALLAGQESF